MVRARIYLEGGGVASVPRKRYQRAFHQLLDGFCGHSKPTIVAHGSRVAAFEAFLLGIQNPTVDLALLLIDSEDPIADVEATWDHLKQRNGDGWEQPEEANNENVLFMTTSFETWILADLQARMRISVLATLENEHRQSVFAELVKLTDGNYSKKVDRQCQFLLKVKAGNLEPLPSFRRVRRILSDKLK